MHGKQVIHTDAAPAALGPYSQAVVAGGFAFCAGQIPLDPATNAVPDGIEAQTRQVIDNLKLILGGLGLGLEHVTMARIYLTEFQRDYAGLNAIWPSFFEAGKLPARTTVGVTGLAVGALVEIDLVARRP